MRPLFTAVTAAIVMTAPASADGPPLPETVERLDRYFSSIAGQVEAGEITEDEAREKLAAAGRRLTATMSRDAAESRSEPEKASGSAEDRLRERKLDAVAEAIREAIGRGDITPEQGRRKMLAVRRAVEGDPNTDADDRLPVGSYDEAERTLLRLVAAGELQPGRAHERLRDLRSRLSMNPMPPEKRAMIGKIKGAFADGVLTREEAERKVRAVLDK